MPARIVVVNDDADFAQRCGAALRDSGYDVAVFTDPILAIDALDAAKTVELLITCVVHAAGKPGGLSIACMARLRRPSIRVLFLALPENAVYVTEHWGAPVLLPTTPEIVVSAARHAFHLPPPDRPIPRDP